MAATLPLFPLDPEFLDERPPFLDIGLLQRALSFRALLARLK
jgi:hypothetical protein